MTYYIIQYIKLYKFSYWFYIFMVQYQRRNSKRNARFCCSFLYVSCHW